MTRSFPRATLALPDGLRSFAHRDYRIFWFSQLFSLTGSWMQSLAQSWLVLTLTDSWSASGPVFGAITTLDAVGGTLLAIGLARMGRRGPD